MMDPALIKQHTYVRDQDEEINVFFLVRAIAIVFFTRCGIVPLEMRNENFFCHFRICNANCNRIDMMRTYRNLINFLCT